MTKPKPLPARERLNELLEIVEIPPDRYGKWSGLVWKVKRSGTKGIGSVAGFLVKCHKTPSRFVWHVKINQKTYLVSRVIYYIANRVDPGELEVDHRDRNTFNNNVRNLRLLSGTPQKHNRGLQSNNTSGVAGVNWYKKTGKWKARLTHEGNDFWLGYYTCKTEAVRVVNEKIVELGLDKIGRPVYCLEDIGCSCCECRKT